MDEIEKTEEIEPVEPETKEEPQSAEDELAERIEYYKTEQKKEDGTEPEKPAEPEEEPEAPVEAESSDEEPASEEEKPEKPKKSATERINEIVFQREQEKREKELAQKELELLKKEIEEVKRSKPAVEKPKPNETLNKLRKERLAAASDMEYEKMADIDDQIFSVMLKMSEETARTSYSKMKQNEVKDETDNAIKDFQTRNVWMQQGHEKYNADKAALAEGIYIEMSQNYTGSTKELLTKVESRVNKVFNSISSKQKTPVSIVGKVNTMRSTQKQDGQMPSLDDEQKRFAHRTYPNMSKIEAENLYARYVKKYPKTGRN